MNEILELMSQSISLSYEVNQLMKNVDSKTDAAFLEAAENGLDHEKYNLEKKEFVDLFMKRKAAFQINNRIVQAIQELSPSEKGELALMIEKLVGENKGKYIVKLSEYQSIIDMITQPEFTFEGNEGYKEMLIDLKDEYSRYHAATLYYDNMYNYLKPNVKRK